MYFAKKSRSIMFNFNDELCKVFTYCHVQLVWPFIIVDVRNRDNSPSVMKLLELGKCNQPTTAVLASLWTYASFRTNLPYIL